MTNYLKIMSLAHRKMKTILIVLMTKQVIALHTLIGREKQSASAMH